MTRQIRLGIVAIGALFAVAAATAEPLLWVKNGRPTAQAEEMRRVLSEAEQHGLPSAAYGSTLSGSELQSVTRGDADAQVLTRYDADLSNLTARFVTHLRYGRVSARAAGFDLPAVTDTADAAAAARRLASSKSVDAELASLEPRPVPYRLLKQTLSRYRRLAEHRTNRPLPPLSGGSLRAGDEYAGAMQLRRQLLALGDLAAIEADADSATLDAALVEALKRFQSRHGLAPDGVLGKQTLAALNVPLRQRVRQIELSMERWRWLSALPRPEVVINIPQFMLYALPRPSRPDEQLLEMTVIVGRPKHRTPVFTAAIEEVVFNPYWDVPSSIMRNELLPKIRKDVRYLERNHFEIVRGGGDDARVQPPTPAAIEALAAGQLRLRQRPGPDNALGPVKFVLPNPYSVRLHGTAEPDLFAFPQRAFSHGCIRVSDPAALAQYVLVNAPGNWDAEAVETALCGTQPRRIKLNAPVRVIVFYATAAATVSRGVMFSPDLYGHDARLEKLLASAQQS
ncbi:MAG TPA: L,D-transpeptidase family protein [Steroidobacter sp.]|uniref:L,D-transpeptidase family protein n=1 Tax=Steroidobacter sp. TaxID=1978227 RepID=UPI002ED9106F